MTAQPIKTISHYTQANNGNGSERHPPQITQQY